MLKHESRVKKKEIMSQGITEYDYVYYILEKHVKHNIHVAMKWYTYNSMARKRGSFFPKAEFIRETFTSY